jgi:hypothetical protein
MAINSFPSSGSNDSVRFPEQLIDPVSKFRVSQPENLIDTDFEYGLQPTKWETVELINNTPSFFSKSGDTTIDGISSIITNAGTREIIVKTELDHGLAVGIPINVTGTKAITADGSYIINSIPDTKTFTYLCKDNQTETASILDLYSSIITGEFFQGSQLRVSDSDGIVTDGTGISTLTITTNSTHGFGKGTPFYFLNLNSTVAQEFQGANTASRTFDASNSATAQTFDGSNTLSSFNIDWSNSATEGGTVSNITSTDIPNSRITVSHTTENFANLPLGTPLYYNIAATSGYFNVNPRGVAFLKTTTSLGTTSSTFQISLVPDGEAVLFGTSLSGTFQIANQARTFAGNNINPLTQSVVNLEIGTSFNFDGANQGYPGAVQASPPDNTLTISSYAGTSVNATGGTSADYYVGAMVLYSTIGTAATGLVNNTTYFVKTVTNNGEGSYTLTLSALPSATSPALTISGGTGTQTLARIGISIDKNIVHIPNSNFAKKDMIEYSFPGTGRFNVQLEEERKLFYFVETAYDAHNYILSEVASFIPIVATGGTILPDIFADGRVWRAHSFTSTGTSNFTVTSVGRDTSIQYLVVGGGGGGGSDMGGGGGAGGVFAGTATGITPGTYTVTVGAGGSGAPAGDNARRGFEGGVSSLIGTGVSITALGGGGGASNHNRGTNPAGGLNNGQTVASGGGSSGGGGNAASNRSTDGEYGGGRRGTGTPGQGTDGGTGSGTWYPGSGGGSAQAGRSNPPIGGDGTPNNILGVNYFWGAGGGGSNYSSTQDNRGGRGGGGGGGANNFNNGGADGINAATYRGTYEPGNAGANTGSGGGGGPHYNSSTGGNGGSGIVVVRYPLTGPPNTNYPSGSGGNTSTLTVGTDIYAVHTFTSGTNNFVLSQSGSSEGSDILELLVVGGGGGGGFDMGGGGGGGAVVAGTATATVGTYAVAVGGGGFGNGANIGGNGNSHQYCCPSQNGGDSTLVGPASALSIRAKGGGFGGSSYWDYSPGANGSAGGNGGGASGYSNGQGPGGRTGGTSTQASQGLRTGMLTTTQGASGFQGGWGGGQYFPGGGAGAGGNGTNSTARADGGPGVPNAILGPNYFWGGGGGGAGHDRAAGNGGTGGGGGGATQIGSGAGTGSTTGLNPAGNGQNFGGAPGGNGGTNTGGGGGGGAHYQAPTKGGNGGSGIVVIRYKIGVVT